MLRGPELLAKVKELGSMPKSDVVRACGYCSSLKDGAERLNYTAFYEALLEAKGMSFGGPGESSIRRDEGGRKLSYIAKVHFNGNLLVGKAYTSMLGLKPGDEFDIKLERKGIRLIPKGFPQDTMPNASASGSAPQAPSPAPVSPAPGVPVPPRVAPPAYPVAPAPIPAPPVAPTPVATPPAPVAAPAPPTPPVAVPPAPPAPPNVVQQPAAPQPPSRKPPVDSWEDSLRKLDQSSRPERWDA